MTAEVVYTKNTRELQPFKLAEFFKLALKACVVDGHCLGWLPAQAYHENHRRGNIFACYNNDDLVGYCLFHVGGTECRIYHTWVRQDARLIMHGRALLDAVEHEAKRRGATRITLWCAVDLAANLFWDAMHFERRNWRWGRAKRARRHWAWIRDIITTNSQPLARAASPQVERASPTPGLLLPQTDSASDTALKLLS